MNMNTRIALCVALLLPGLGAASATDVVSPQEAAGDDAEMIAPAADAAASTPRPSEPHAVRSAFTTMVRDREPMDDITTLGNDVDRVYFFTELAGMDGQTVTHRWQHDGRVMAEVPFDVRGSRWRVWSSKALLPQWLGAWKVSVVDGGGNVVHEATFEYVSRMTTDR